MYIEDFLERFKEVGIIINLIDIVLAVDGYKTILKTNYTNYKDDLEKNDLNDDKVIDFSVNLEKKVLSLLI